MTTMIRNAAATAGLLAALALPAASFAATTTTAEPLRYTLQTQVVDRYHPGAYDGVLALTIYPSGIVQGTYRSDDGRVTDATGGLTGKNIWLEIGSFGRVQFNGTFENGVLKTVAAIAGPNVYELDSVSVTPAH